MEPSLPLPPFLTKTYDMVDDSLTEAIVSWSPTSSDSFVVWDFYDFSRSLLPRFFKHNNFSSFVRQLNTYGFRKADPDRWEFSHAEFVKGQRHRLKNIHRKKSTANNTSLSASTCAHAFAHVLPSAALHSHAHAFAHTGAPAPLQARRGGLQQMTGQEEGELEQLRRERIMMISEIDRLAGQHRLAHQQIKGLSDSLQAMEIRQQQIVAFVTRTICAPTFLHQYVNQAVAADHCRAQLKLLEDFMEESDSNGARKRRRFTYSDHCAAQSGVLADCTEYDRLQLQLCYVDEHGSSSGEINEGAATSRTTSNEESDTAPASHDRKLLVQMNVENASNSTRCSNDVNLGGGVDAYTHNLTYYNQMKSSTYSRYHHQELNVTSTCRGMLEDVTMRRKTKMKQPIGEGYALTSSETQDYLRMMDLNLQPFNVSHEWVYLPSNTRVGRAGSPPAKYMQVSASSSHFEDLESELFWQHLLEPVSMMQAES